MRSPDAVLASIPGWETASWKVLPGGTSNVSYLLQDKNRRAVLKIDETPRKAPFNTRQEEFDIQALAARAMLASEPLYADETVYLCEYAEGHVWSADELRVSANLRLLAAALRELHSLPCSGRSFGALAAAEGYANIIVPSNATDVSWHVDRVRRMSSGAMHCFCHNDLVAENVIMSDRVRFLDWEYACDNDPLFDLATVVTHHGLNESQTEVLLLTYFGPRYRRDSARILERLNAQSGLYESLHWLWDAARTRLGSEQGSDH